MLILPGSSCISSSKRETLLHDVQRECPKITSVDGIWIHIVLCRNEERENELKDSSLPFKAVLDRLLTYGDDISFQDSSAAIVGNTNIAFVLPRLGSISPWSSKATDI